MTHIDWDLPHAPSSRPAQDRYVGLLNKTEDFQCVMLGSMGLSDKAIMKATGLTQNQVTYRLHKARPALRQDMMTRMAWRAGESPFARALVSRAAHFIKKQLSHTLRQLPEGVAYSHAHANGNGA